MFIYSCKKTSDQHPYNQDTAFFCDTSGRAHTRNFHHQHENKTEDDISTTAIEALGELNDTKVIDFLNGTLNKASKTFSIHPTYVSSSGCTFTAALVINNKVYTSQLGDSAAFIISDQRHTRLTEEQNGKTNGGAQAFHTKKIGRCKRIWNGKHYDLNVFGGIGDQDCAENGIKSEYKQEYRHGLRFGKPEFKATEFTPDDSLFVCSDGYTDFGDKFKFVQGDGTLEAKAESTLQRMNKHDDTTAILASCTDGSLAVVADGHGTYGHHVSSSFTQHHIKTLKKQLRLFLTIKYQEQYWEQLQSQIDTSNLNATLQLKAFAYQQQSFFDSDDVSQESKEFLLKKFENPDRIFNPTEKHDDLEAIFKAHEDKLSNLKINLSSDTISVNTYLKARDILTTTDYVAYYEKQKKLTPKETNALATYLGNHVLDILPETFKKLEEKAKQNSAYCSVPLRSLNSKYTNDPYYKKTRQQWIARITIGLCVIGLGFAIAAAAASHGGLAAPMLKAGMLLVKKIHIAHAALTAKHTAIGLECGLFGIGTITASTALKKATIPRKLSPP